MKTTRRRLLTILWMYAAHALVLIAVSPRSAAAQTETVEYYATDAIGSVRVVFNAAGNVIGRMDYAPFGQELYTGLLMPNERFAELSRDGEAGLDYAQARMYQPRTGRFTSPDTVYAGLFKPQLWNRYTYALSGPVTYSDPSGLCPSCWAVAFAVGAATAAASGSSGSSVASSLASDEGMLITDDERRLDEMHAAASAGFWGWVDSIQTGLDGLSIAADMTGIGATVSWIPDAANGTISLVRGDFSGAGLSALAMIPYIGIGANAARISNRIYSAQELVRSVENVGDVFHNFPATLDPWIYEGTRTVVSDSYVLYSRPGTVNGVNGVFEIGVRPSTSGQIEVVTHRFFRPGGGR